MGLFSIAVWYLYHMVIGVLFVLTTGRHSGHVRFCEMRLLRQRSQAPRPSISWWSSGRGSRFQKIKGLVYGIWWALILRLSSGNVFFQILRLTCTGNVQHHYFIGKSIVSGVDFEPIHWLNGEQDNFAESTLWFWWWKHENPKCPVIG